MLPLLFVHNTSMWVELSLSFFRSIVWSPYRVKKDIQTSEMARLCHQWKEKRKSHWMLQESITESQRLTPEISGESILLNTVLYITWCLNVLSSYVSKYKTAKFYTKINVCAPVRACKCSCECFYVKNVTWHSSLNLLTEHVLAWV